LTACRILDTASSRLLLFCGERNHVLIIRMIIESEDDRNLEEEEEEPGHHGAGHHLALRLEEGPAAGVLHVDP
jgi:hypothetical protein